MKWALYVPFRFTALFIEGIQRYNVFFKRAVVAVLACSLTLGWSPASYRAYADGFASAEAASEESFECENATGGCSYSSVKGDSSFRR